MKTLYSYKASPSEMSIKDIDGKKGIVTGYFASFGNKDSDGDIIQKGAFAKTIAEQGPNSAHPRIKHLMNHDITKPLGKILVLQEDSKGLYYESQVGSHSLGQDFIKMVESGLITEHSIGYTTVKNDKKSDANYLVELKLMEGSSLSAWGANEMTPLTGIKSLTLEDMTARVKALDKFCRTTTATDETVELLLIEIKQLLQIITDTKTTEPPVSTLPEDVLNVLQTFTNNLKAEKNGQKGITGAA